MRMMNNGSALSGFSFFLTSGQLGPWGALELCEMKSMYSSTICSISILIDVELPIEVDDEYWYHPDPVRCFEQPPGKPSLVTGFNQMIAIMRILGVALRVLVCRHGDAEASLKLLTSSSIRPSVRDIFMVQMDQVGKIVI
jgi:hypothetical protein